MVCMGGCFCPKHTPIFDDALGKCITAAQCPKANACEANVTENYLDSGNAHAHCSDTTEGAICDTACSSGCVPRQNLEGGDKLVAMCGAFTQATCGVKQSPGTKSEYCEWVGTTPDADGPTFVCTAADDGDGAWTVQDEGTCSSSGGVAVSVCDYLKETDCLDQGKCIPQHQAKCMPLVNQTFDVCQLVCTTGTPDQCGTCLSANLYASNTLNLQQPDVFSCCGCLEAAFAHANIDKPTLLKLLASPCQKTSPTETPSAPTPSP